MNALRRKWSLTLKVVPFAAVAILLKLALHKLGWEVVSLNPLFPGLLAATVFLIGFLISGVLTDYKESEKLPGELAVSLEALFDEGSIIHKTKGPEHARAFLEELIDLSGSIRGWLHGKLEFEPMLEKVEGLNVRFAALEPVTLPQFIGRLKGEQTAIRRSLTRIRTIKETSFVGQGYTIAEVMAAFLIVGILLARIEPFYESLFFSGLISFLLIYMLRLIKDLDDPFEYGSAGGSDEVSLMPLEDVETRMRRRFQGLS
jgi:hypothetical protein